MATTGAEPAERVDDHRLRAADQALARAQQLSMMLTGQPLTPRMEVAVSAPGPAGDRGVLDAAAARGTAIGMPGQARGGRRDPVHDRGFWVSVLVPLLVFVGLLVAMGAMAGDGTRVLLAIGAVFVGVLVAVLPSFLRGGRPESDPQETKDVLDVMAGALIALRGEGQPGAPAPDAPPAGREG